MRGRSLRGALGRCLASSRRWLPGLVAILLLGGWPLAVAAQEEAPAPADSVPAGGEAGPMAEPCEINCTVYAVDVTPDGQSVTLVPHTSGTRHFTVLNRSSGPASFTFTCTSTGGVTCGTVSPGALAMARNSDDIVTVGYSVGATGGTLTLTATGHATDAGSYVFAAPAAPSVQFTHLVRDHLDRGACFTTGAGEAAGVSCGDLFVVHGMPAYRTLGRDRALSLYYNSAAATGLALVAAKVTQPAGAPTPTSVKVVLSVGGTARDSATYNGFTGSKQVVLGLGRGTIGSLPTGIHPVTLAVKNVFSGSVAETVVTDELLVVNRAGSEYGQGWSLLGVEQLVLGQPANAQGRARLLWLAGDGSARVYTDTTGSGSVYHGAPGEAPDSLVRYWHQPPGASQGSWWYRRDLKHGVKVFFDEAGRHRETHNRVGAVTTFQWDAAGERLDSITVPPNDNTSRRYRLFWHPVTARLDSITDPGGRKLGVTMAANGTVTRLTDPDGLATRFAYTAGRLATRVVPRNAAKGDSAVTRYAYGTSATHGRLTKVEIQADSVQTQWTTTVITPWDHQGLATSPTSTQTAATITHATYGIATRVDGPLAGTGDAADVWVNRYGQPTRTTHLGLNTTTTVEYAQNSVPLLPTKITYPTGRTVDQSYNGRGNLVRVYDVTPQWGDALPLDPRETGYFYDDAANAPDSPTRVRQYTETGFLETRYAYNALGLTDSVVDPRGHRTVFAYQPSGPLTGVVRMVTERSVPTWQEVSGSSDDVTDVLMDHVTRLGYDANGNPRADTAATGVITSYTFDSFGRPTHAYDPLETHTERIYDVMNRVTAVKVDTGRVNHPDSLNPLGVCLSHQSTCTDPTVGSPATWPAKITTAYLHGWSGIDSIIDARGTRRGYRYDVRGLLREELDEADIAETRYYSVAGLLDSTRTRMGVLIRHEYDALGRRTKVTIPARVQTSPWNPAWVQTTPGDVITYTYDAVGQLATAQNRYGIFTHRYYGDGSLWQVVSQSNAGTSTLTYEYTRTGARSRLVHADEVGEDITTYNYNAAGDLSNIVVQSGDSPSTRTFGFTWDSYGRRRQIDYPTGIVVRYRYDAAGVLRRVTSTNPHGGMEDNHEFTVRHEVVDPVGRILEQTVECVSPKAGNACQGRATYSLETSYDRLGHAVAQVSSISRDSMRYDASGNLVWRRRLTTARPNADPETYVIGSSSNRIVSMTNSSGTVLTFQYNADGSRGWEQNSASSLNDRIFYYDGMGRPTGYGHYEPGLNWRVTVDETRYDALGRMVVANNGTGDLLYDGDNVIGSSYGSSGWHFIHAPGIDNPLMGIGRNAGQTRTIYWITDGSGRQFAVGDSTGRIPQELTDQSGWIGWGDAGGTSSSFTFDAGRHSNGEVPGLAFFRNRVYDQVTGRWTQEDPLGVAGGLNLYQFNGNSPTTFTDPFGLKACDPPGSCILKGILAGGAAGGSLVATASAVGAPITLGGSIAATPITVPGGILIGAVVGGTLGAGQEASAVIDAAVDAAPQVANSVRSKIREFVAGTAELFGQSTRPRIEADPATDARPGAHSTPPPDPSPVRKNPDGSVTVEIPSP